MEHSGQEIKHAKELAADTLGNGFCLLSENLVTFGFPNWLSPVGSTNGCR
jgi:hypothetical protein